MKTQHIIIGFNPGLPSESLGFTIKGAVPNQPIANEYPKDCNNKPCLCFYSPSSVFPAKPTKCQTYDSSVVFHGFGRNEIKFVDRGGIFGPPKVTITFTLKKQDPSLFSDYPADLRIDYETLGLATDKDFTQSLYIEKFVANGKTHIFISSYLKDDGIDKRVSLLAVCPDNSDDLCIKKKRNAYIDGTKDYCYYDKNNDKCISKNGTEECKLNERITKTCICGTELVDMDALSGATRFCFKRSTDNIDNKLVVLPFNCKLVLNCSDYCKSMTLTDDCDSDEVAYCAINRCGISSGSNTACEFYDANGKHYCRPSAGAPQN